MKIEGRVLALILVCALALPLSACHKNKIKIKEQKYVSENDPYFTATEVPLDVEVDASKKISYKDISMPYVAGDRLVAAYNIQYEIPEDIYDQVNEMYADMQDGEEEETDREVQELYAQYSDTGIAVFDIQGHLIKKHPDAMADSISGLTGLPDDGFMALVTKYTMEECVMTYSLIVFDNNGEKTKETPLDKSIESIGMASIYPLDNGDYLISSPYGIYLIDSDGRLLGKDSSDKFRGNVYKADGKYYALLSEFDDDKLQEKCTLNEIDINTGKISNDGRETTSVIWNAISANDGFYTFGSNGVSKIDPFNKNAEPEMVLDWDWADFNRYTVLQNRLHIVSADEMYFFKLVPEQSDDPGVKHTGSTVSLVRVTRTEKNPHAGKAILSVGSDGAFSRVFIDNVVSYNLDVNHKCRVLLMDYSEETYYADDIYSASKDMADRVYLDMLAGEGPDILLNFSSYCQFNNENILVDLNVLIDGQNGLDRNLYFDNVFRAFETNGKMYQIPVCIDIHGFIANRDLVGDRTSWTYDEFMSIGDSLPEDVSMMEEIRCNKLLEELISVSSDTYVDYGKKSVDFEGDAFRKALEIAKRYGTSHPAFPDPELREIYDRYGLGYSIPDTTTKLENGMQAMTSVDMYDIEGYAKYYSLLKERAVFLGVPSPQASGLAAAPKMTLAIASSCANPEEAWDFVRYMFEKDQQVSYAEVLSSISVNKEALDEKNTKAVEDYQARKEFAMQMGTDDLIMYAKYDLTSETSEAFANLVGKVTSVTRTDPSVMMIVNEEAPGYFEGQRSIEDVCKNIQNRATTVVNER